MINAENVARIHLGVGVLRRIDGASRTIQPRDKLRYSRSILHQREA